MAHGIVCGGAGVLSSQHLPPSQRTPTPHAPIHHHSSLYGNNGHYGFFNTLDRDASGSLSLPNLTFGIRKVLRLSSDKVSDDAIRYLFDVVDLDRSGAINVAGE